MLTTDVFTELGSRRGVEVETWPQDIPEIEKKCKLGNVWLFEQCLAIQSITSSTK